MSSQSNCQLKLPIAAICNCCFRLRGNPDPDSKWLISHAMRPCHRGRRLRKGSSCWRSTRRGMALATSTTRSTRAEILETCLQHLVLMFQSAYGRESSMSGENVWKHALSSGPFGAKLLPWFGMIKLNDLTFVANLMPFNWTQLLDVICRPDPTFDHVALAGKKIACCDLICTVAVVFFKLWNKIRWQIPKLQNSKTLYGW